MKKNILVFTILTLALGSSTASARWGSSGDKHPNREQQKEQRQERTRSQVGELPENWSVMTREERKNHLKEKGLDIKKRYVPSASRSIDNTKKKNIESTSIKIEMRIVEKEETTPLKDSPEIEQIKTKKIEKRSNAFQRFMERLMKKNHS